MVTVIAVSAVIIVAGGLLLCILLDSLPTGEAFPFALGVVLTSVLNILKIFMLERTAKKIVEMTDPNAGKNYLRLQYLFRFFLTGAILLAAAVTPFINMLGAIAGVFTLQIAAFSLKFIKLDDNDENI